MTYVLTAWRFSWPNSFLACHLIFLVPSPCFPSSFSQFPFFFDLCVDISHNNYWFSIFICVMVISSWYLSMVAKFLLPRVRLSGNILVLVVFLFSCQYYIFFIVFWFRIRILCMFHPPFHYNKNDFLILVRHTFLLFF